MTEILNNVTDDQISGGIEAMQKLSIKLVFRFAIDFISVLALIRLVYYRVYRKAELFFTFFIFNLVIFLICFLLNKVDLSMGAAFGLFAVFSMLRYRTEDISIKDMSYLFLVIAMGLINAVTKIKGSWDGYEYMFIGMVNAMIILLAYLLESKLLFKIEQVQVVTYDNVALLKTSERETLLKDLAEKTGLKPNRISIGNIDYIKDSAQIKIYYFAD